MNAVTPLERICRAMSDPAFYPHPVPRIEFKETHISAVFLTGDWVYKLKKPKNLGFLDFRELSDREHFCRQEVLLNQRLSTGVYEEVVGIFEDASGRLSLGPDGTIVEYAVKMRQLSEESSFATLLENGEVTAKHIAALGNALSAFHAHAERGPKIDAFGDPEVIRFNMEENFEQIGPFVENRLSRESWDFVCEVWRAYWKNHKDLFLHRVQEGKIRDGHGDLRLDHIYFQDGVQIIDCIEFNQRFRYGDAALDLAFLLMDLDYRGHSGIGRNLLAVCARKSKDPEMFALLDFYAAYRALVRLKVACLSLEQADGPGRDALLRSMRSHLRLACLYALSFGRPTLWIFSGLPASGKSTLAQRVAGALFMPLFQSDTVRKQDPDFQASTVVPFNTGMYRPVLRGRVYAKLLNLAQEQLKKGQSVALDATFSETSWRRAAAELARDVNVGLIFLECSCAPETIKARLTQRETASGASDARLMHFEDMLKQREPFPADLSETLVSIDTDRTVEESLFDALEQAHALKRAQAQKLLRDLDNGPGDQG